MSDMAAALKMVGAKMGLHLLSNSNGTWSFAGSVPFSLAYVRHDGAPVTEEEARQIARFGLGLFRKTHGARVWRLEAEAREAATSIGYTITERKVA